MESQSTVVCVRLRPAGSKETGVRTVRPEGDNCIHFTNPDKSISAYAYDKVYGKRGPASLREQQEAEWLESMMSAVVTRSLLTNFLL